MEDKNNEIVEVKKNNSIGLIIIIVVLIIISLSLGIFVFINRDKLMDNKEQSSGKVKVTETNDFPKKVIYYSVDDEKISHLIDNLTVGMECDTIEEFLNDKKIESNDISNTRAFKIVAYNKNTKIGTLEEVTKEIQKFLGSNYKFDPTKLDNLKGACISHYYDKASNTFMQQETACGGTCGPITSYQIVKAQDTDGVLEMAIRVIFVSTENGKEGIYSDYEKTNKIATLEEDREYLYKKGSKYKVIFRQEDGNYVFTSAEPINQ